MSIKSWDLGRKVETLAAEWWVQNRPGKIIARNFFFKGGEVDLIAEEPRSGHRLVLVFIEVRSRGPGSWWDGLESIDGLKRRRIECTVEYFLSQYRGRATEIRLDVLAWDGRSWFHLPDAWQRY